MLVLATSAEQFASVFLQACLVILLLFGPTRRYFVILGYSLLYLFTSVTEVLVARYLGRKSALYHQVYWVDEILLDLLLFFMVIWLAYRATEDPASPVRGLRKLLLVAAIVAIALPLLSSAPLLSPRWYRFASQVLNFGGTLLNMGLWMALIASKKRDPQLMLVSTGLGIAVTGQAIYYGAVLLTNQVFLKIIADQLNVLTHILGVAIWCYAFRPSTRKSKPSNVYATGSPIVSSA